MDMVEISGVFGLLDDVPITLTSLLVAACDAVFSLMAGIDAFAVIQLEAVANVCGTEDQLIKSVALLVSSEPPCIAVDRLVTSLELVSGV